MMNLKIAVSILVFIAANAPALAMPAQAKERGFYDLHDIGSRQSAELNSINDKYPAVNINDLKGTFFNSCHFANRIKIGDRISFFAVFEWIKTSAYDPEIEHVHLISVNIDYDLSDKSIYNGLIYKGCFHAMKYCWTKVYGQVVKGNYLCSIKMDHALFLTDDKARASAANWKFMKKGYSFGNSIAKSIFGEE